MLVKRREREQDSAKGRRQTVMQAKQSLSQSGGESWAFEPLAGSVTGCGHPRKGVTLQEAVLLQLRQSLKELTAGDLLLSAFPPGWLASWTEDLGGTF